MPASTILQRPVAPAGKTAVAEDIRQLARQHGVTYEASALDAWADQVTRLAGDDVELDDVENLLVALVRAKAITSKESTILHAAYLNAA